MQPWRLTTLGFLLGFAVAAAMAAEPGPADPLQAAEFTDQWDQPQALDENTRWLVVAQGMDAGDIVEEVFTHLNVSDPGTRGLLYLADISGMPGLITRFIALPAMRDFAFPMALIREEGVLETMDLPLGAPEAVTVLELNGLQVVQTETFTDSASFEQFLVDAVGFTAAD